MKTSQKIDKKMIRRFMSFVKFTNTCWLWTGYCNEAGYGMFFLKPKTRFAHRVSYWLFKGDIKYHEFDEMDTIVIDHLCNTKGCMNPAHLEAVTQSVNTLRGIDYHAGRSVNEPKA